MKVNEIAGSELYVILSLSSIIKSIDIQRLLYIRRGTPLSLADFLPNYRSDVLNLSGDGNSNTLYGGIADRWAATAYWKMVASATLRYWNRAVGWGEFTNPNKKPMDRSYRQPCNTDEPTIKAAAIFFTINLAERKHC